MAWQLEMGYKEVQALLRMIEIFYILTVGNTSMYLFAKTHLMVHLERVHSIIGKLSPKTI